MSAATFTFRVEESLKAQFADAAKARDQTSAQLLRDFMRYFVQQQRRSASYDAWFRCQVQKGINDANAGRVFSHEEVEARFGARRDSSAVARRQFSPAAPRT